MKQITIAISDRTHEQVVELLHQHHDRNPFPEDLFEFNLESLVESLLTRFLDEQIPALPRADLNTLYVERSRYLPRLRVLTEVIRQFDVISVDNLDVHRFIRLITQEQVLRRLQVEKAVRQFDQAIAQHPDHCPNNFRWLATLEAATADAEFVEEPEVVCDAELLAALTAIVGE